MFSRDSQKKLDIILAKFNSDQRYKKKFFTDFEFAKRESDNIGLQIDSKIYEQLRYSYEKLNNMPTKSETFEKHWNELTYNGNYSKPNSYTKSSLIGSVTTTMLSRMSNLQLKFRDRGSAGFMLASILKSSIKNYKNNDKDAVIVLGIPRGGVIIADIIARRLSADFDIIFARKLGDPENKDRALGAVTVDENGNVTKYINQKLIYELKVSEQYLDNEISIQIEEIKYKRTLYFNKAERKNKLVKDKTVILVDDGVATGATIITAARLIRKQEPRHLIIAAPVAPHEIVELLKQESDAVNIITSPYYSHFKSIGQFYRNFDPVTDDNIMKVIYNI
jgi:predicted phosphoribosyltransferase